MQMKKTIILFSTVISMSAFAQNNVADKHNRELKQPLPSHINGQITAKGQHMPPPHQMGMNQENGQQRPNYTKGGAEIKLPPGPGMMGMNYGQTPRGPDGGARR